MEPATKRGRSGVENASAASRAMRAAISLSSSVRSSSPYSPSVARMPPKVLVSTTSAPASRYSLCIWRISSGRVSLRISGQPSSSGVP